MESRVLFKLDQVLYIMLCGHLKENVDDTLQQKLLDFLSGNNYQNFPCLKLQFLLENTKLKQYVIAALKNPNNLMDGHRGAFALRLLGVLSKCEEDFKVFQEVDNVQILESLNNICQGSIQDLNFSSKDALFNCLSSIVHHDAGIHWVKDNNCISTGFRCLVDDGSLYVQQAATRYLSLCLQHSMKTNLVVPGSQSSMLQFVVQKLKESSEGNLVSKKIFCKYAAVLKLAMECDTSFTEAAELQCHLLDFFKRLLSHSSEELDYGSILSLICILIASKSESEWKLCVEEIIEVLKSCNQLVDIMKFLINLKPTGIHGWLDDVLMFILMPFKLITGTLVSKETAVFEWYLEDKQEGKKLILLCLSAFGKVLPHCSVSAQKEARVLLQQFLNLISNHDAVKPSYIALVSLPKIQSATIQTLAQILGGNGQCLLNPEETLSIIETTIAIIRNVAIPVSVVNDSIKLCVLVLNAWHEAAHADGCWNNTPQLQELGLAFEKRCLDTRWEMVDSVFQGVCDLTTNMQNCNHFVDWLCSHKFHLFMWDYFKSTTSEPLLRAMSIQSLGILLKHPAINQQFLKERDLTGCSLIENLLAMLRFEEETFVRRAIADSLPLVMAMHSNCVESVENIFPVFYHVITKDLDWEVKISCLKVWKELVWKQSNISAGKTSKDQMQIAEKLIADVCKMGFSVALLSCLEDPDETVMSQSLKILTELRKIVLDSGFPLDQHSQPPDDEILHNDNPEKGSPSIIISRNSPLQGDHEREAAMKSVLDMPTSECIKQVMHEVISERDSKEVNEDLVPFETISCSIFLHKLSMLCEESSQSEAICSTNMYDKNPESLLDDIILAAKDSDIANIRQLMDCY